MDTYTKFNAQFEQMVIRFDEFRQSWKQHVVWIEEENVKTNNRYPVQIKRNTWATNEAVSQTLNRLTAIDKQLTTRENYLAQRNIFSDHITLEDCIAHAMQRSPVSCETRAWQFTSAVAEAEDSLQADQLQLETYERQLDEHVHRMEAAVRHVAEAVQSKAFPLVCTLHDFKDRLEADLSKGSGLEHDEWCALENKLDATRRLLSSHRNVEAAFLAFAALLSGVGVKIARQRLISEFFHKLSET